MDEADADCGAMRLAFRLALLDAAGTAGSVAERRARLEAGRGLLAAALAAGGGLPTLAGSSALSPAPSGSMRGGAAMAAALRGGFEDAWAELGDGPGTGEDAF